MLTVRKPVRLGARTYLSGSEVRWRDLGLQERKADQLVRLGYFVDPYRRGAEEVPAVEPGAEEVPAVRPDTEDALLGLAMSQLRALLPEGVKARSKKKAVRLILEARELEE